MLGTAATKTTSTSAASISSTATAPSRLTLRIASSPSCEKNEPP